MKKLVIVVLVLLSGHLYSQDKIHLMNKTILEVKVIEIETYNVKYSSINNPNGAIYNLSKSEISHIIYTME